MSASISPTSRRIEAHEVGPRSPPLRFATPRSRATLRSARWMSTLTAPSDRPSTPAISAVRQLVDEAQDHRLAALAGQPPDGAPRRPRLVAPDRRRPRRRAGRRRSSRRSARPVGGARDGARRRSRCGRSGTARRGRSRRPRRRRDGRAPRTGRGSSGPRRRSPRWRPPRRDGRRARSRRRSTRGRGTCDTGRRSGPGRAARPRPAVGLGRDGRSGGRRPSPRPISTMPAAPFRYTPP